MSGPRSAAVLGRRLARFPALPQHGLRARYYPNPARIGPPMATTIDREPAPSARGRRPAGRSSRSSGPDSFAYRSPGTYTFSTVSYDGSELEIGETVVVQNGGIHGPQEQTGTIGFQAGIHPIRLRYEQAGGGLALEVRMARQGAPLQPIRAAALFPDRISLTEYRLRRAWPLVTGALFVTLWIVLARLSVAHRAVGRARGWTQPLGRSIVTMAMIDAVSVSNGMQSGTRSSATSSSVASPMTTAAAQGDRLGLGHGQASAIIEKSRAGRN